jgi:DNA-directed RNA polymerase specialized sigma24 family protein
MGVGRPQVGAAVAALGDRALVAAMRAGESPALAEFYRRFRPVLVAASGRLAADGDRETLVEDTLTDAAVYLIAGRSAVPMSVAGYLVRGLRNRVLNDLRARERLARRVEAASEGGTGVGGGGADEAAVEGCSSEYGRRISAGPDGIDAAGAGVAPAVARLAAVLDAAMTADERVVATWLANGVTQHQIAEWLGLSDAAASKRVSRLRARLRAVAARHTAGAEAGDRRVLAGFLRRAGHVISSNASTGSEGRR